MLIACFDGCNYSSKVLHITSLFLKIIENNLSGLSKLIGYRRTHVHVASLGPTILKNN
jgi:hypothetical protein